MVVVPTLLMVVPALLGHPSISADNLIQNFPLRVLSGRQIASGHLPLLNPYANSGTPLLGGLNAGALYPLTLLFAFLPPIAAWLINVIAVYVTAATGMFALLRGHGLSSTPSLLAALSFSYTGAMMGQFVHLGVIQGFALIPWTVLILVALSRRLVELEAAPVSGGLKRALLPSALAYALVWGLVFLSGEPRGIAEIELITLVVAPAVLLLHSSYALTTWRARWLYVATLVTGLMWGVGIGLVQLLPGWSFINSSQRSTITYWFFGSGSLALHWTPLLFVQDLFGGNGALGQPRFFIQYNLPEVTGYAGLVALIAVAGFFSQVTWRGWVARSRDFTLYLVLGAVGLFATWGSFTPIGHLFRDLPLFGSTRLQSRNVIIVDFAASVLLGWWLDRLSHGDRKGAGAKGARRWVTSVPAIAVGGLCVAMLLWGRAIVANLGSIPLAKATAVRGETLTLTLHLVVATTAFGLVLFAGRVRQLSRAMGVVLAVDVALFLVFSATGVVGGGEVMPSRAAAITALGSSGRTALVDSAAANVHQFAALGSTNGNVFTEIPSVQGYGSLISSFYETSTGTHGTNVFNPCPMVRGTFTQLRLSAVAVASGQFHTRPGTGIGAPSWCLRSPRATSLSRYFGQLRHVATITLRAPGAQTLATSRVRAQLLDGEGRLVGPVLEHASASSMAFDFSGFARYAAGVRLSAATGLTLGDTILTTGGRALRFQLDTPFQVALGTARWHLTSTPGPYSIFRAAHVAPSAWLAATRDATITNIRDAAWGDSWITVHATSRVELRRSMAYLPGWRAIAVNEKGREVVLTVVRHGLIQQVRVPRGDWTVHFHYHAPHIEVSLAGSLVASVAWLVGVGYLAGTVRRTRASKVRV